MAADTTYLSVHVTPRAGRDEVAGVKTFPDGEAVCVRVCAPPDGGKANKAVCKLIAEALGIPKSRVNVNAGHTSRRKRLAVECASELVTGWVAALPQA
ncbi:DUF167 domain-containing protein [Eggerthella sp. YY7918]|uniref:DUF167 domain-containing protein n=1 Tax=Eggerthella sp. (strain YY7918) TaxID=502558 RepID=UPI00021711C9|nr:DUF167 domain-containing protein [Eggerthella sp. YY7918]BAK44156.1 hypothetical protein EGYY_09690 [Eggerthella sp. YY7918]